MLVDLSVIVGGMTTVLSHWLRTAMALNQLGLFGDGQELKGDRSVLLSLP